MEPRFVYGFKYTVSSKPHRKKTDLTVIGLMDTVRYGFDDIPTVRLGAVLRNRGSYGAVRCGFRMFLILRCGSVPFPEFVNATVRFGAVFRCEPYGAVRLYFMPYGAVRCGFPIS